MVRAGHQLERSVARRNPAVAVALVAALLALASIHLSGLSLDGYVQGLHPVALPGARGVSGAAAFNLLAFVLPGLAVGWLAWSARGWPRIGTTRLARLALQCLLIAAAAHAAQGLLPLDPMDLDATESRLHAAAWTVWWLASVVALVLGAVAALCIRPVLAPVAAAMGGAAVAMAMLPATSVAGLDPPVAQRLALALWFGAVVALSMRGTGPTRR